MPGPTTADSERDGIRAALTALVAERGYRGTTLDAVRECTGGAYAAAAGWREGLRAAAWAYCRFLQKDHERARFLGRLEHEGAAELPRERAEGIVGAIWERIATFVLAGEFDAFPAQVPELMYLTVFPYLGADAAREDLRCGPEDTARYERGEI